MATQVTPETQTLEAPVRKKPGPKPSVVYAGEPRLRRNLPVRVCMATSPAHRLAAITAPMVGTRRYALADYRLWLAGEILKYAEGFSRAKKRDRRSEPPAFWATSSKTDSAIMLPFTEPERDRLADIAIKLSVSREALLAHAIECWYQDTTRLLADAGGDLAILHRNTTGEWLVPGANRPKKKVGRPRKGE